MPTQSLTTYKDDSQSTRATQLSVKYQVYAVCASNLISQSLLVLINSPSAVYLIAMEERSIWRPRVDGHSMEELSPKEAAGERVLPSIFHLRESREFNSNGEITICDLAPKACVVLSSRQLAGPAITGCTTHYPENSKNPSPKE
ncbi:uncharacterized protein Dsimw501_GD29253 [Drosophila simulans]|uniref:Uncharacterized protein n=1 Tax=Drosophila simulans TaxID=7240 RepID=A0A0J9RMM4_DROSI|nr:uncharacterized protein Dsimw501_GD29253 [Drosophila simulans]